MVQPRRGLWVTDPGAFPFDDRVTVAAGWFGSPLPIGSRALGSLLSGFYPFSPCRVGDPARWPSRCQATTAMVHCTVLPLGLCPVAPRRGARAGCTPQPRHPLGAAPLDFATQPSQPTATTPAACPGASEKARPKSRVRNDPSICTRREAAVSDREGVRRMLAAGSFPESNRRKTRGPHLPSGGCAPVEL